MRSPAGGPTVAGGPTAAGGPTDAGAILEVAAVGAGYGDSTVLRDVTFAVPRGAIVSLLGPNGCGKTTLLRIIGRLHAAWSGTVRLEGRDVRTMSPAELARSMATVSQVHRTSFPFSVLDVLLTGRTPYVSTFRSPGERDVRRCREVLDWFGIGHLADKAITRLSGGERQLVMIARALAQEPRLLLLDEPTTYLDLHNQGRVLDTLVRLVREHGLTALMTIHDPNQALAYSDRAVLLRRLGALEGLDPGADAGAGADAVPGADAGAGADAVPGADADAGPSLIAAGDPAEVLSPANVLIAYGVPMDAIEHRSRRLLVPTD